MSPSAPSPSSWSADPFVRWNAPTDRRSPAPAVRRCHHEGRKLDCWTLWFPPKQRPRTATVHSHRHPPPTSGLGLLRPILGLLRPILGLLGPLLGLLGPLFGLLLPLRSLPLVLPAGLLFTPVVLKPRANAHVPHVPHVHRLSIQQVDSIHTCPYLISPRHMLTSILRPFKIVGRHMIQELWLLGSGFKLGKWMENIYLPKKNYPTNICVCVVVIYTYSL